jgi:hypothetical protein
MVLRRLVSRRRGLFSLFVRKRRMGRAQLAGGAARLRDGRDCMLEDQLFLRAGFHNQRKFIEALDAAQQLGSIHQIDCNGSFLASREIQKPILDVLWRRL